MGEHFSTNFSSWDLAVPGSPSISRLTSPRRVSPSGSLGEDKQVGKVKAHWGLGLGLVRAVGWQSAPNYYGPQSKGRGRGSGLSPRSQSHAP